MGLINQLFGRGKQSEKGEDRALPWIPLAELAQIGQIKQQSEIRTQYIFKHSTSCGISSMVLRMLENQSGITESDADFYFLDLHRNRHISDAVASDFQVRHESPQLLIVKEGEVVLAASHGSITELDLLEYM